LAKVQQNLEILLGKKSAYKVGAYEVGAYEVGGYEVGAYEVDSAKTNSFFLTKYLIILAKKRCIRSRC